MEIVSQTNKLLENIKLGVLEAPLCPVVSLQLSESISLWWIQILQHRVMTIKHLINCKRNAGFMFA